MRISWIRLRNTGKHFSSLVGREACNASRNFRFQRMWKLCVWTGHAQLQSKAGRISTNNLSTWACFCSRVFRGWQAEPGFNFFMFPMGNPEIHGNPLFAICHRATLPSCNLPSCNLPSCHLAILPSCHLAILPSCHLAILPSTFVHRLYFAILPSLLRTVVETANAQFDEPTLAESCAAAADRRRENAAKADDDDDEKKEKRTKKRQRWIRRSARRRMRIRWWRSRANAAKWRITPMKRRRGPSDAKRPREWKNACMLAAAGACRLGV